MGPVYHDINALVARAKQLFWETERHVIDATDPDAELVPYTPGSAAITAAFELEGLSDCVEVCLRLISQAAKRNLPFPGDVCATSEWKDFLLVTLKQIVEQLLVAAKEIVAEDERRSREG